VTVGTVMHASKLPLAPCWPALVEVDETTIPLRQGQSARRRARAQPPGQDAGGRRRRGAPRRTGPSAARYIQDASAESLHAFIFIINILFMDIFR
jgi:hypothetical protein